LRLYRDIRILVDQLAERAECPPDVTNFRTKIIRLRDVGYIGEEASCKLNRISTMTRKAGCGEIKPGELEQLVQSATKWLRKLVWTERQTKHLVPVSLLAGELGVSAEWIEANWLQREVDPLPYSKWCDGRPFIDRDTLRDWRASQPVVAIAMVEGGAA
jgi:hypothetical protein